jgi:serine/threonine-protein kinase RsbW
MTTSCMIPLAASKGFCRTIPSVLTEVGSVCGQARDLLKSHQQDLHCFAVDLLLHEFINNAIIHGNRLNGLKEVSVSLRIGRHWIRMQIADQGNGFNWKRRNLHIPDSDLTGGRGLLIGMQYAQRIAFNRTGSQVTLWIRK